VLARVYVALAVATRNRKYVTDIHQPGPLAFVASAVVILGGFIASAVPPAVRKSERRGSAAFRVTRSFRSGQ